MCTKFEVDSFENGVLGAFQRPKKATFRDSPMHYQVFRVLFLFLYVLASAERGSKVFFQAQDAKTT